MELPHRSGRYRGRKKKIKAPTSAHADATNNSATDSDNSALTTSLHLLSMPVELVVFLLTFLDSRALGRVMRTCKKLCQVIASEEILWRRYLTDPKLCRCPGMCQGSLNDAPNVSAFQLVRVSHNWQQGTFHHRPIVQFRERDMPIIQCNEDTLFYSHSTNVHGLEIAHMTRSKATDRPGKVNMVVDAGDSPVRFRVTKDWFTMGLMSGNVAVHKTADIGVGKSRTASLLLVDRRAHREEQRREVLAVDQGGSVVAAAFHSQVNEDVYHLRNHLTIWNIGQDIQHELGPWDCRYEVDQSLQTPTCLDPVGSFDVEDRVWTLALDPDNVALAMGTAGHRSTSLLLYDVETCRPVRTFAPSRAASGQGILHVHFESPHVLVTGSYDTTLRIWDTRTSDPAVEMTDPHDNAVYCACSDVESPLLAAGMSRHAVVNLWDRRFPRSPFRMIYSGGAKTRNSPVYSMIIRWDRLFVAFDTGISLLDFATIRRQGQETPGSFGVNSFRSSGW